MFFTKVKRIIKSGFVNFWRNGLVSLSAVLVLTITLFVIGSLIMGQAVLDSTLAQFKDKVDINVYFKTDAKEETVLSLKKLLEALPEVRAVEYVSRDAALAAFRDRHKDNSTILSSLDEIGTNPLGASLNIKAKEPSQYEAIAQMLQGDGTTLSAGAAAYADSINEVTYFKNKTVIDRLSHIITSAQKIGLAIALLLSFMVVIVTFNTIRLIIYNAREEIAVMKLVGASNNYVRGPFLVEGIMFGFAAACITMALLFGFSVWLGPVTQDFFGGLNLYTYYTSNFFQSFGILIAAGIVLASFSSYLAVRRYLNV